MFSLPKRPYFLVLCFTSCLISFDAPISAVLSFSQCYAFLKSKFSLTPYLTQHSASLSAALSSTLQFRWHIFDLLLRLFRFFAFLKASFSSMLCFHLIVLNIRLYFFCDIIISLYYDITHSIVCQHQIHMTGYVELHFLYFLSCHLHASSRSLSSSLLLFSIQFCRLMI